MNSVPDDLFCYRRLPRGHPKVCRHGFRWVSEGFQRVRNPGFLYAVRDVCMFRFALGLKNVILHFAWFKSVLTTCLTGLEMVSQGFQTGFRESSELFQIDVKGVLNSGCFYLV